MTLPLGTAKKPKRVKFCSSCCLMFSARRMRACDCGNTLSETTAPASLECLHCGADAIESASGLFCEGDADECATCGFPGHVSVDEDTASWSTEDCDNVARCKRLDCTECLP